MSKSYLIILVSLFTIKVFCQELKPIPKINSLSKALKIYKNDAALKNASLGFYAVDVNTGEVVAGLNSNLCLTPASIQKLFSTATALEVLGSSFRFQTELQYDGKIDTATGILDGNIYIRGGGDPALGSSKYKNIYDNPSFLSKWADAIKKAGIDSITGSIISDAQLFGSQSTPGTWIWADMGNYYGAGISALSVYDNFYKIELKSENKDAGWTKIISVKPQIQGIKLINEVKASVKNKDNAYIYGAPFTNTRIIRGTIPKAKSSFTIKGSIPDPAFLLAYDFEKVLVSHGISVAKGATSIRRLKIVDSSIEVTERKNLFTTFSPKLKDIIYRTNMFSVNLYAEQLAAHVGLKRIGEGSTIKGVTAIEGFWQSKGMDVTGFYMNDGCGLSRHNALTPKHFVYLLKYMQNKSKNFEAFNSSLPVAGQSGTLKYMCKGTTAQGKIRAKSGSMNRVRAYAGYATTKSGRQLAFAMIANNFNCYDSQMKKKLAKLMTAMADFAL